VHQHDSEGELLSTLQLPWTPPPSLYDFEVEDAEAHNDIGRWVLYLLLRIRGGPYDGHRLRVRVLNRQPTFDEDAARAHARRLAERTFSGHIARKGHARSLRLPPDFLVESA
jgi:hypothetical protein